MFNDTNIAVNPLAVLPPIKEPRRYTLAEYLHRSEKSEELLEYYDGIITKLPMARTPHNRISTNVITALNNVLDAQGKGRLDFRSDAVASLKLDFEGIVGNRHRGMTRRADARVPYLKRGTEMRNTRHLSIVSVEDCAEIARRLDLAAFDPAWIGANLVVEGIPHFSYLPRGAKLIFDGGVILTNEDQNAPCSIAGEAVMLANPGRDDIKAAFPKVAKGLRGVVVTVEHPGELFPDCAFTARLPEQWIYR